jgi:putative peptidoglycan lipid II flippase
MSHTPTGQKASSPHVADRHRGLMARTVLVSLLTLLSRLLGFAREALMAFVFGDRSPISDAFYTAWRWPNLFRRLLGEGALSTALQTAMTRADAEEGDDAGRALFRRTARGLGWLLVVLTVVGMGLAALTPDHMPFTGWAWLGEHPGPVRDLTVRLLPYVVLVCLAAICGGALAVRGHFAIPNLAPTLMNLVWIGTLVAIGLATDWGGARAGDPASELALQWRMARWLAWGLLLGGLVQLLVHLVPLARHHLLGGGTLDEASRLRMRAVLRTTVPLVVGAGVYQLSVLIDGLMAQGLLATGGPSALYYANRVQQFPLALISTAAISAVFPALNAHGHLGELGRMRALHDRTQLGILFLVLPSAVGLFALALPIASVCYEHGNYGLEGTRRVAEGLRCLAFALLPAGAAALAGRVYLALGDFRTPVRIAAWMLLANVLLNVLAVLVLGLDVAGLTLSTALTSGINTVWLLLGLRRRLGLPPADPRLPGRIARIALASLASGAAAWGVHRGAALALDLSEPRRSIPLLLAAMAAGGLSFLAAARLLEIPEYEELTYRLRRRLAPPD